MRAGTVLVIQLMLWLCLWSTVQAGEAGQEDKREAQGIVRETEEPGRPQGAVRETEGSGGEMDLSDVDKAGEAFLEEYTDVEEVERALREMTEFTGFSFTDLVLGLVRGEIPLDFREIGSKVGEIFLGELRQQKSLAVRILLLALVSAVFSNFIRIFESSQIAEISFYMIYLLISALLMKSFASMEQITSRTMESLNRFMQILLPSYVVTVVFSSGTVSALGFYEITLLVIHILQVFIIKIILPLVQFYMILLILNQMTKEDYFSKLAELLRTGVEWITKTVLGLAVGLQAVQCLIAPAVDSLKNSAASRIVKALPGVGNVLDAATETVAASAVVIKNAVGVAGILAVAAICLPPLLKLAAGIFLFRLLCALIQPISEKRMVGCIDSVSGGAVLLFRILLTGMAIFVISLAMITASVKGG